MTGFFRRLFQRRRDSENTDDESDSPVPDRDESERAVVRRETNLLIATLDYLGTPLARLLFEVREVDAYYASLKQVDQRRDIHERLIGTLEAFLEAASDEGAEELIDLLLGAARLDSASLTSREVLHQARELHPEGFRLLDLAAPVDVESLKKAYKAASRKYHPDRGGSHEDMVALNQAFPLFHSLLLLNQLSSEADSELVFAESAASARSSAELRRVLCRRLFEVCLDEWNLLVAVSWLGRLEALVPPEERPHHELGLIGSVSKLVMRLARASEVETAERLLPLLRRGVAVAQKRELFMDHYLDEAEQAVSGNKTVQVRLNHPRQAANALELGLIDEARARKVAERYSARQDERTERAEAVEQFAAQHGYLADLPPDAAARGKRLVGSLVPEPGYFETRLCELSDAQQAEYLKAFGGGGEPALARKYLFVRLQSLLETAVLHPDHASAELVIREVRALGSLKAGSAEAYAEEVASAIEHLERLPRGERQKRAQLLNRLADQGGRSSSGFVMFSEPTAYAPRLTTDYLRLVVRPLRDLEVAASTGQLPADPAETRAQTNLEEDLKVLRAPKVENSSKRAFAAIDLAQDDIETATEHLRAHCELLLEVGEQVSDVQQVQLGYWVNRLTILLAKQKRWQEALDWLERFRALPDEYRGRSSDSELAALKNREARCRKALGG